jgi:Fe-S-cluster containining protein
MSESTVDRPVVRSFKRRFANEAAAWVRSGGHAVVWDSDRRAQLVFQEPSPGDDDDLGAWAVYDFGKSRWQVHEGGEFDGLASALVPPDCLWIVKRRAERDSMHEGPRHVVGLDCRTCAACCVKNEVFLNDADIERFRRGGRDDLTMRPFMRRKKDGKVVLTLLEDGRCHHLASDNSCEIYELRPDACSEFPMGSECCLYAREEELEQFDGVAPGG